MTFHSDTEIRPRTTRLRSESNTPAVQHDRQARERHYVHRHRINLQVLRPKTVKL